MEGLRGLAFVATLAVALSLSSGETADSLSPVELGAPGALTAPSLGRAGTKCARGGGLPRVPRRRRRRGGAAVGTPR
jgi:hypothetical protein